MIRHLIVAVLILQSVACADSPSAPRPSGSGLYRLATVNGQSLPYLSPPSVSATRTVDRSDLLLGDDGSFGLGLSGQPGYYVSGAYEIVDGEVRLTIPNGDPAVPAARISARIAGDSIVMTEASTADSFRLVYRRAPRPNPPSISGVYQLRSVNGRRDPLTSADTMIAGDRYVSQILFDSIRFDGFFYRRHRSQRTTLYRAQGDSLEGRDEWISFGSYSDHRVYLILLPYAPTLLDAARDSLVIAGDDLIRLTHLRSGTLDERYARTP